MSNINGMLDTKQTIEGVCLSSASALITNYLTTETDSGNFGHSVVQSVTKHLKVRLLN